MCLMYKKIWKKTLLLFSMNVFNVMKCSLHNGALAYAVTSFGAGLMHSVFNMYYVKVGELFIVSNTSQECCIMAHFGLYHCEK